jgi:hypothetical protein
VARGLIPAQYRVESAEAISERKLIRGARAGDQDAFAELVVIHAEPGLIVASQTDG